MLLLLARVVQGFSTGGEYGGAATFIAEYSTDRNRGLMGSWLEFGTLGGYIAGAGTVTALHMLLSSEQMLDWGWRIPFLVAGRWPARPVHAHEAGGNPGVPRLRRGSREA